MVARKKKAEKRTTPLTHVLIPKHLKVSEREKKELLERYHITLKELPKILLSDPAIAHLGLEPDDVVKIIRPSPTAGEAVYYRGVIDG
ncbi:MAG: DNA-directed RNA polymerase subunit H [DPANN group archaeon]|nr:DNA-directed RNA polymerase subunit H [DPANN group archaeon]